LIFLKGINVVFGELATSYKKEAKAATLKVFHECKQNYENEMSAEFDGNEHDFFDGQLSDLHNKKKLKNIEKFKMYAAPDLRTYYTSKLEQVFF
jgi:hypothetical protein